MVLVTNLQYYMNSLLADNLNEVPSFLKKLWDCVIIVSGHGKVRIGKSTLALQIGYYLAWLMVGGEEKPKKMKVPFTTENVVFDPDSLMKIAAKLPMNSIIVYDEGRAGLDSARAMENINKIMMDFFQECGVYGHIIIIVLPNFHRLREDIAIPRSLFLVDTYTGKNYRRGFFKFYNEIQKEYLYVFGKRKIGTFAKYNSAYASFSGRFTKFCPIDKDEYERLKREALKKKIRRGKLDIRFERQRNQLIYFLHTLKITESNIAKVIGVDQTRINEIISNEREKIEGDEDEESRRNILISSQSFPNNPIKP